MKYISRLVFGVLVVAVGINAAVADIDRNFEYKKANKSCIGPYERMPKGMSPIEINLKKHGVKVTPEVYCDCVANHQADAIVKNNAAPNDSSESRRVRGSALGYCNNKFKNQE